MERTTPSLAELLSQTIDSFEQVELSRKCFSSSSQEGKLRLDCLALKLSRWAELVGLSGDIRSQDARFWQKLAFPTSDDFEKAHQTLEDIRDNLYHAKERAAKAEARDPSLRSELGDDGERNGGAANGFSSNGAEELHRALWDVCNQRRCKPAYAQRAVDRRDGHGAKNNSRWGLYTTDEFAFVANTAVKLVDELADALPARRVIQDRMELERRQLQLVDNEVQALAAATTEDYTLRLLLTLVQHNDDSLLSAAIARKIQSQTGPSAATGSISLHFNDNHGAAIGGNYHQASITNNFGKY